MSDADHTLTLTATGRAQFDTTFETDAATITRSRTEEITADLELDADELYNSRVATTHRNGVTIHASDVADVVCEDLDAVPVDPREWELTLSATLDDWQHVALEAAKQQRSREGDQVATALDVLVTLHDRHAETDRPIYAALNIDETFDAGRREELLEALVDEDDVDTAAAAEEVTADAR